MMQIRPAQAMTKFASEMYNVNKDRHCYEENSFDQLGDLAWYGPMYFVDPYTMRNSQKSW